MVGLVVSLSLPFPSAFSALANINLALEQGSALALLKALQSPALGLRGLQTQNSDWYLKQLQSDQQQKRQVGGTGMGDGVAAGPSMLSPQVSVSATPPPQGVCPWLPCCPSQMSAPGFHAVPAGISVPWFHSVPQVFTRPFSNATVFLPSHSLGWWCFKFQLEYIHII